MKFTNDREMAYWLQGYFEISGRKELTEAQAKKIVYSILHMGQKGDIAATILKTLAVDESLSIRADLNTAGRDIAAYLEKVFVHQIDPEYAGTREQELRGLHSGQSALSRKPGDNGPVAMC